MADPNLPQPLIDANGTDISGILDPAWQAAGISRILALACVLGESNLDPKSERWGTRTAEAKAHIQALQDIVTDQWADISFGYAQQIVAYHYLGDKSANIDNVLFVRQSVFKDPGAALMDMCGRLAQCLTEVQGQDLSPVHGDEQLAALVFYNHGSWPAAGDSYWVEFADNVANYRAQLARIRSSR